MSIKILTQNAIDVTNIDGARENHFSAGMRSGIVKGAFNEGNLFLSASNIIALDTCELRISGHRIIIESPETITFNNSPTNNTSYSLIAQINVSNSNPVFSLLYQSPDIPLIKNNLFNNSNGDGVYQVELGTFILKTDGTITDLFRTIDIITGGAEAGDDSVEHLVFNGIATSVSSDSKPQVNIDYNEETKQYDFHIAVPKGERGEQGLQGIQGIQGEQGVQGEKGEKGDSVVVDSELSTTSTNAIQNSAVAKAIGDISSLLDTINGEVI